MRLFRIVGIASFAATLASAAQASVVDFVGSTEGCFGATCSQFKSTTSDHNLSFSGTSFNVSTDTQTNVTLGSFTLKDTSLFGGHIFNNEAFDLKVDFTQPFNSAINFSADVTGFISVLGGLVAIDFSPASISFGNSAYVLDVNNLLLGTSFLAGGKDVEFLTGTIGLASPSVVPSPTGAVPESSTWFMMIVGFSALAFFGRRFRPASCSANLAV